MEDKQKHIHTHNHGHHHADVKNISIAFFLNLGFTIIEIIGGLFTNSIAILSDAIHDLGDSFSLGLAWYFQHLSKKKGNSRYSYGYKRFSLLGAVINSVILVVGSIFILSEAIPRLLHPQDTNAKGMFLLAILGVIVNGAAVLRLKKGSSINEKVISLHLLEDVLGWLAILIGSIFMYFFEFTFIDPLLSVGISIFILYNVYKNLNQSLRIILQGTPHEIDFTQITEKILQIENVNDIHDLHIWSVDGEYNILTVHAVIDDKLNLPEQSEVKERIRQLLLKEGIQHTTIEFEAKDEICELDNFC